MSQVVIGKEILPVLVRCIREAKHSIWVMMFEWSWYSGQHTGGVQDINRELCIAAKEGKEVRALLHNESMGRPLHKINRKTAAHLLRASAEVRWGSSAVAVHAKLWLFDGVKLCAGSHNISLRSVRVNREVSVLIDTPDEVKKAVEWYRGLWGGAIPPAR